MVIMALPVRAVQLVLKVPSVQLVLSVVLDKPVLKALPE
jgi:hypothetical protein